MPELTADAAWLPQCTLGWSMPAVYYTDDAVFAHELDTVFRGAWLFAGHSCELRDTGDYLVFALGTESVIIVRGTDGELRAFHNVCRHRGSRICAPGNGRVRAFTCPYHQWTYGVDGELRAARLMGENFAKADRGLLPVAVRESAGLVFVSLADSPSDFDAAGRTIAAQLTPHALDAARVAHRMHYRVGANWKTIVENNRECYHCRGSHPEFLESNFEFGTHGDPRQSAHYVDVLAESYARWSASGLAPDDVSFPGGEWFRVARLPLREGFRTETTTGEPAAPPMGDVGPEPGSLRIIGLPTMWAHADLDYAMTTRLTPINASVTDVDVTFLVDAAASDVDVDAEALTQVWTATSEQDWQLCEANYQGVCSRGYRPGPLSPVVENSVQNFHEWYLHQVSRSV